MPGPQLPHAAGSAAGHPDLLGPQTTHRLSPPELLTMSTPPPPGPASLLLRGAGIPQATHRTAPRTAGHRASAAPLPPARARPTTAADTVPQADRAAGAHRPAPAVADTTVARVRGQLPYQPINVPAGEELPAGRRPHHAGGQPRRLPGPAPARSEGATADRTPHCPGRHSQAGRGVPGRRDARPHGHRRQPQLRADHRCHRRHGHRLRLHGRDRDRRGDPARRARGRGWACAGALVPVELALSRRFRFDCGLTRSKDD